MYPVGDSTPSGSVSRIGCRDQGVCVAPLGALGAAKIAPRATRMVRWARVASVPRRGCCREGEKDHHVSTADLERVKQALLDAGVEIYRTRQGEGEIQVAERVRLHIMDSGVRICVGSPLRVRFTARSQQSDFPNETPEHLFGRVRDLVGEDADQQGFAEATTSTVEVKDPVDDHKILDVWHEVTYEKTVDSVNDVVDEVRWALLIEKYVSRH